MNDTLQQITTRLAAGSQGRTEADVQSDVRKFLLDAPLELEQDELLDVSLEAQAGAGRRIDVEAGCAAIEVKKSLGSQTVFDKAVEQLAGYVTQRTEERGQRYVGVLTDGQLWVLFHAQPDGALAEVQRLTLKGGESATRLASWLESVLATTEKIKPTPDQVARRLGATSPGTQLDLADLRALYAASKKNPEVQLKRELWARLLIAATGTNFEDSDELFVTHTYLVLTAEVLAHAVMGISVDTSEEGDVRALLEGHQFDLAGLHGVVEADFFDWPAVVSAGAPIVKGIARRLSTFDWSQVEHDVLKTLYESVIDTETRHNLGEYYTPDWLAQKIVSETYTNPLEQTLLDPACGSGTFLFWSIRHLIAACDAAGLSNRQTVNEVVRRVHGMDLHPVAVTLARVTYLLALSPERLADRDELTVPVYLGDSVRWEQDNTLLSQGGITVHTSDGLEFFEQELFFPEGVVEDPARFDRLVETLARRAADRQPNSKPPGINGVMNAHKVVGEDDRAAVETVFAKLCRLHDAGRDHLWSYYIRNLARPLAFTRPSGRVDVLVGNPPWLEYRYMPAKLQATYQALAKDRGLWAGGKVATHQNLSDLFVARAVEQYLKPHGRFSFVLPYATLSRRQYAGFRTGDWSGKTVGAYAQLERAEEFARVKPPLFPVPACVVSGARADSPRALPADAVTWTGRVPDHHLDWPAAAAHLASADGDIETAGDSAESPYRQRFTQGATLVPRMLVTVRPGKTTSLGLSAGRVSVESSRSAIEKQPWKSLTSLSGTVEEQFVRPMHLGATIVAHRPREPARAIIPWADGELLDGSHDRLDEFPGLAAWWREAERQWERNKTARSQLSLLGRLDYQRLLQRQFPGPAHRVVYTKSGQHLAACRIEDTHAVIDHKLYWAAAASVEEARYLTAILNSQALADAVAPLQARGQHNPRDFDMHVFALRFPFFDPAAAVHAHLASLASQAERVAAAVELSDGWQFQKARRVMREALRDHGIAGEIDATVEELVRSATGV